MGVGGCVCTYDVPVKCICSLIIFALFSVANVKF